MRKGNTENISTGPMSAWRKRSRHSSNVNARRTDSGASVQRHQVARRQPGQQTDAMIGERMAHQIADDDGAPGKLGPLL